MRGAACLLLAAYLLLVVARGCRDQPNADGLAKTPPLECITLRDVCIDQQHFITYAQEFQPWHSDAPLPSLSIKDLTYNWPNPKGNGDRYVRGWNLHYPHISIRPNSSEEACRDTQQPSFDPCNVPLIMWARWPYNLAEAYGTVYARLWLTAKAAALPAELLPVLATPHGLRSPKHLVTLLGPLFTRPLTTLAQMSARRPEAGCAGGDQEGATQQQQLQQGSKSGATSEQLGRCYKTAHLCKFRNRDVTSLVAAARDLQRHYAPQIAELTRSEAQAAKSSGSDGSDGSRGSSGTGAASGSSSAAWDGLDDDVLKVVFALRPGVDARSLLNDKELLEQCNTWVPEDPASSDEPEGEPGSEGAAARRGLLWARRGLLDSSQHATHLQGLAGDNDGSAGQRQQRQLVGEVNESAAQGRGGSLQATATSNLRNSYALSLLRTIGQRLTALLVKIRTRLRLAPGPYPHIGDAPASVAPCDPEGRPPCAPEFDANPPDAAYGTRSHTRHLTQSTSEAPKRWRSAKCVGRVFGSGPNALLRDMGFMAQADVLVCLHGAACLNTYFMPNGSSVVEVRPLGMNKQWASEYFYKPVAWEQVQYWYGIDIQDPANSKPSVLEEEQSDVLNKQVRHRERHVRLPWPSLKHHLDLIAHVGGDPERYRQAYRSGTMYISDTMERMHVRLKLPEGVGWR